MTGMISEEDRKKISHRLRFFTIMATVTGIFLLILVGEMIAKYGFHIDMPIWLQAVPYIHGWIYVLFLIATLLLGTAARWTPGKMLLTALAGTIPFCSFWMESKRRKEVLDQYLL